MFTGIVAATGSVVSLQRRPGGAVLGVTAPGPAKDAVNGDSIAVNGACLTVVDIKGDLLSFDLSEETLKATNLGRLKAGEKVNLESALRADGRLGGHFVTGHVDAAGTIKTKTLAGNAYRITIEAPPQVTSLLVEKGSVAVDGISLTVVDVFEDSFTVVIIPHTANVTTIGFKNAGDGVNLEADILGKYVAKFLGRDKKGSRDENLMESLMKAGYV